LSAISFLFFCSRAGGVDANGKKKKDFVANYNIKLLGPMLKAMTSIQDSMQDSTQETLTVKPTKRMKQ